MSTSEKADLLAQIVGLAAPHLKSPAAALEITRLTGDASTRSYFRVRSDSSSLIVALYSEPFDDSERASTRLARLEARDPSARLTFANDPCAHVEVTELF